MWASSYGHQEIVELLLNRGAKMNQAGSNGHTPLMWAIHHEEIVELLLNRGAKIDQADSDGHTPLVWAGIYGHQEIVKLLLKRGAIELLLNHGANVSTLADRVKRLAGELNRVEQLAGELGLDFDSNLNIKTRKGSF
jgi:serine/threonine-protein phosphatase 6 regulatory ankyrin repeat subunit B